MERRGSRCPGFRTPTQVVRAESCAQLPAGASASAAQSRRAAKARCGRDQSAPPAARVAVSMPDVQLESFRGQRNEAVRSPGGERGRLRSNARFNWCKGAAQVHFNTAHRELRCRRRHASWALSRRCHVVTTASRATRGVAAALRNDDRATRGQPIRLQTLRPATEAGMSQDTSGSNRSISAFLRRSLWLGCLSRVLRSETHARTGRDGRRHPRPGHVLPGQGIRSHQTEHVRPGRARRPGSGTGVVDPFSFHNKGVDVGGSSAPTARMQIGASLWRRDRAKPEACGGRTPSVPGQPRQPCGPPGPGGIASRDLAEAMPYMTQPNIVHAEA
jgi:hypothetical protein